MTRSEAINYLTSTGLTEEQVMEVVEALRQEPCEDAISREAALKECHDIVVDGERYSVIQEETLLGLPPVKPQYTDDEIQKMQDLEQAEIQKAYELGESETGQFAKWVATEIFDENWEYNKDAFAELACRKLAKLGIVRAKGDKWELVEPQESEKINCKATKCENCQNHNYCDYEPQESEVRDADSD